MVSVFDVAKHSGLSIATVSRALSGNTLVKEKTRERVLTSAEVLGYKPNTFAQGLRHGRGKSVALVTGDIRHGIYAALAKHVQHELESLGLDMLLYDLDHREQRLHHFLERASGMGLRGLLLASADAMCVEEVLPQFQKAVEQGIVLASVTQRFDSYGITSIVHDNRGGAELAVRHFHAKGRGPVAYLGRIATSGTGRERYEGYLQGLKAIGQRKRKDLVLEPREGYRSDAGYRATSAALERKTAFGAILAASDDMALGAMSAIRERGLRIPEDVAVIGFGGFEWGKYVVPPLTTLALDVVSMAARIRTLFEPSDDQETTDLLTLIPPQLVVRQSS